MVNKTWFETKLEELATAFQVSVSGDKWRAVLKIYYQALGNRMSDIDFGSLCQNIMIEEERFPTIAKFFAYRKRFYKPTEYKTTSCYQCEGSGSVTGLKDGRQYCFRCDKCDAWQGRLSEQIPLWSGHNGYEKKNYGWDNNDPATLKGLLILGKDSTAWKKAPEDVRSAATEMEKGGWKPRNDIFEITQDPVKEKTREESIRKEQERYLDPTTGNVVEW